MIVGWQGAVITLAVGSVIALAAYIVRRVQENRNMNQSHRTSSFRESPEQVINQRNITCPFCNKFVRENDHQLTCGHRCHKSCYEKRSATNKNCTYCQHTTEEATTSSTRSSRKYSTSNECCYCQYPIQSSEKPAKLGCKHTAHKTCYDVLSGFVQCQACNLEKSP